MEPKVRRGIGLVAHDAMKKDLIEWVLWNSELLMGNKFYCTGTTGTLILEALKEKHPEVEWDFTILVLWEVTSRWDRVLWTVRLIIYSFSLTL